MSIWLQSAWKEVAWLGSAWTGSSWGADTRLPVFQLGETSSLALQIGLGDPTFTRTSAATVVDHEDLVRQVPANCALRYGARIVENLATGLVTETITVINGNEYQVTIAGGSGDTAVCSNAFTGTLTANGTNRISWNSGTPKTAGSTSLTITVTGTLTELLVEDVTGQPNQNPGEYVSVGVLSAPYHGLGADGIKAFDTENGNTVDGSGVVTESTGSVISPEPVWEHQPAVTNLFDTGDDLFS